MPPRNSPDAPSRPSSRPAPTGISRYRGATFGTATALLALAPGSLAAEMISSLPSGIAITVAGALGGLLLGAGLGVDLTVSEADARTLFAVGAALNAAGFVGLATGDFFVLLAAAPVGFTLKGVFLGGRLSARTDAS